jgi:hypothetical protein
MNYITKMKNTTLSPEAQAVLDAFLAEWPDEALEQDRKCLAAALRAVADRVMPKPIRLHCNSYFDGACDQRIDDHQRLLAIADELEGSPKENERPDRLIKGDVWEFELEVQVKGKRKPQVKKLQFKVIGYHHGECAWQLVSLGGEHYCYLLEFAPQYEDMTYIGNIGAK